MSELFRDERYYHGLLRLMEGERGVIPCRFGEEQLKLYQQAQPSKIRSLCPAGVSIELETDATRLTLRLLVTGLARQRAHMAVVIDDVKQPIIERPIEQLGEIETQIALDGALHRVEIYLPHLVSVEVLGLEMENASVARPVAKREKLYLAFGDSITQGMEAQDVTRIYPTQVARNLGMEQLNLGVGGARFLPELVQDVGLKPSLITIAYGTNDRNLVDTEEQLRNNIEQFLSAVERVYPGVRCVVIVPPWSLQEEKMCKFTNLAGVRAILRQIVKTHPAMELIEGMALVPGSKNYLADELHPNDLGFQLYAASLIKRLL